MRVIKSLATTMRCDANDKRLLTGFMLRDNNTTTNVRNVALSNCDHRTKQQQQQQQKPNQTRLQIFFNILKI